MLTARVNAVEYGGDIVIERVYSDADSNVPAWEEMGLSELCGDKPITTPCHGRDWVIGHSWSSIGAAACALASASASMGIRVARAVV